MKDFIYTQRKGEAGPFALITLRKVSRAPHPLAVSFSLGLRVIEIIGNYELYFVYHAKLFINFALHVAGAGAFYVC